MTDKGAFAVVREITSGDNSHQICNCSAALLEDTLPKRQTPVSNIADNRSASLPSAGDSRSSHLNNVGLENYGASIYESPPTKRGIPVQPGGDRFTPSTLGVRTNECFDVVIPKSIDGKR